MKSVTMAVSSAPGDSTLASSYRQSTTRPSGSVVPPRTGQRSGVSSEPSASPLRHTSFISPFAAAVVTRRHAACRCATVTRRERTTLVKRWYESRGTRRSSGSERLTAARPNFGQ